VPALDNAKHERFAQGLAKGKTQEEAYREAGYQGDRTAACRLSTNVNVTARVAEIQERAATRAEISVASVTANLARIADKAEKLSEASGLSVARAAWMDAAKLNGLVIDKSVKAEATLEDLLDSLATGSAPQTH
jgi:hypothetical protein